MSLLSVSGKVANCADESLTAWTTACHAVLLSNRKSFVRVRSEMLSVVFMSLNDASKHCVMWDTAGYVRRKVTVTRT